VKLGAVGDAHEVAVEYLWPLYSVRITIEMASESRSLARTPYLARQLSVRKVVLTLTSKKR
jgi:hypothetical protein